MSEIIISKPKAVNIDTIEVSRAIYKSKKIKTVNIDDFFIILRNDKTQLRRSLFFDYSGANNEF